MWTSQSFSSLLPCWCKNCVLFLPLPSPPPPPQARCSKSSRLAHGEWLAAALSSAKQYCADAILHNQKINTRFSSPTLSPSSASWKPLSHAPHTKMQGRIFYGRRFIQATTTMTPTQRLATHWRKHKTEPTGNNRKLTHKERKNAWDVDNMLQIAKAEMCKKLILSTIGYHL